MHIRMCAVEDVKRMRTHIETTERGVGMTPSSSRPLRVPPQPSMGSKPKLVTIECRRRLSDRGVGERGPVLDRVRIEVPSKDCVNTDWTELTAKIPPLEAEYEVLRTA